MPEEEWSSVGSWSPRMIRKAPPRNALPVWYGRAQAEEGSVHVGDGLMWGVEPSKVGKGT